MLPGGYVPLHFNGAHAVVRADAAEAIHAALAAGTLFEFAARHPERRALAGRGVAYAIPLTPLLHLVVRHNRHGGLLAPLTGDRFLAPTRAPHELATSVRLRSAGVPTPEVVATVRYPAGGPFERADVATAEVRGARDLAAVLMHEPALHAPAAAATGALLGALARVGAHHGDINIKNVLLAGSAGGLRAYVLDVDRVTFRAPGERVAARNWGRFERSARKWRERHGAPVTDDWLATVRAGADAALRTP